MKLSSRIAKDFVAAVKSSPYLITSILPISLDTYSEYKHADKFIPLNLEVPNPIGRQYVHADRWFYANGVLSDRQSWKFNAEYLSFLFDKKIEALFNPTASILFDLLECIAGRTFLKVDETTKQYMAVLRPAILSGADIHIVAYSQGGITIRNALKELEEEGLDLSKVNVYTFGSAHNVWDLKDVYSEHFANSYDIVARLGVLAFGAKFNSKIYKADCFGHFLNAHYLANFINGHHCGGKSKLYSFLAEK